MDSLDHHQLQQISQIVEALSHGERATLSYLCEGSEADPSLAGVKDLLKHKLVSHESPHLFLPELLLRIGRFDIMRNVCKVSRDAIQSSVECRQVLSGFRVLMVHLSENMTHEDVDCMKFILSNKLSREKTDNAKNFLHLMTALEKLDLVSPDRVDLVEECLLNIGRTDLSRKVASYKKSVQRMEIPSHHQRISQTREGQFHSPAMRTVPFTPTNQNSEILSDCYKLNTIPRGVCVIIDCVGNDGGMMEETFKALQFNVTLHKWHRTSDIHSTLSETIKEMENLSASSFVCCIMSRSRDDCILGTDPHGRGLHLDFIRRMFTANSCTGLAGKPKVFFIQKYNVLDACPDVRMKHQDEDLETDGDSQPTSLEIPMEADIFWSQCWTDVCQLEEGHHRSIYLKALTEALENPQRRNLDAIHTAVNKAIFDYNQRKPERRYYVDVKHTLRKNLYLK